MQWQSCMQEQLFENRQFVTGCFYRENCITENDKMNLSNKS